MDASRFEELLKAWHEGDASPEELAEFEALLRSDPRHRRELVHSVLLDVHLYRRYAAVAKATEAVASATGARTAPRRRFKAWEAAAAAIVFAISAVAVMQLLLRPTGPSHRVLEGDVASAGRTIEEGREFEVRGPSPALIQLKDGTQARLAPKTLATLRATNELEIVRGSGTFVVGTGPEPFRVTTPSGLVWGSGSSFSVELLPLEGDKPEVAVAVHAGKVQVNLWGVPDTFGVNEDCWFGPPVLPGETDYYALLKGAKLTLIEAIDRAVALAPGVPIKAAIEKEDGQVVIAVDVAQGRQVREIEFDLRTGEKLREEVDDEDESPLAAAVKVPLRAVVERNLGEKSGRLVEAELELKDGKIRSEVKRFRGGRILEFKSFEN